MKFGFFAFLTLLLASSVASAGTCKVSITSVLESIEDSETALSLAQGVLDGTKTVSSLSAEGGKTVRGVLLIETDLGSVPAVVRMDKGNMNIIVSLKSNHGFARGTLTECN